MFVLKVFIGVISILTAVKIGKNKADAKKECYFYFQNMLFLCDKIISDLSYKKSNLYEILNYKYSSNEFIKTVNSFIKRNPLYVPEFLSFEESMFVQNYFSSLGTLDSNTQIKNLEAFKDEIKKIYNEKYQDFKKYYTLFMKLGFVSGLTLFILVI
ncbi:MAG: hypothetical protein J6Q38_01995 [Clostridia bacterium]|nr:hypothetical protein [Clostridia bacterium]